MTRMFVRCATWPCGGTRAPPPRLTIRLSSALHLIYLEPRVVHPTPGCGPENHRDDIALRVCDIHGIREELAAAGAKIPQLTGSTEHGTPHIAFVEASDGYEIELIDLDTRDETSGGPTKGRRADDQSRIDRRRCHLARQSTITSPLPSAWPMTISWAIPTNNPCSTTPGISLKRGARRSGSRMRPRWQSRM